jgi:hypothetical protein
MKHFHNAALDYMWQREAQTSKNWRIRLYVLMEVPGSSRLAFALAIFLSAAIIAQLIVIYLQKEMSPAAQLFCDAVPMLSTLTRPIPHPYSQPLA